MLNEASNNALFAENLLDIGFHTLSLMNSTYPSTIWNKSSGSFARALAKNFVSDVRDKCTDNKLYLR